MKLGKELSINKKTLQALGQPEHILFWWNESDEVLLLGSVPEPTDLSFKISERYYRTRSCFKIEKKEFLQTVMNIAGWNNDVTYTIAGTYMPELHLITFQLDSTECECTHN
jgi:hypothetical protein